MIRRAAIWLGLAALALAGWVSACAPAAAPQAESAALRVVAIETFLADIAQNVAGDRLEIDALLPIGSDPHSFAPTPQDVRRIAASDVIILNGAGFEEFLDPLLENAGSNPQLIVASKGLTSRALKADEPHNEDNPQDPHFWFDPLNTVRYAENIRDGLSEADPAGAAIYRANTDAYIQKLNMLDAEIRKKVSVIPVANRKLVTDHDTFGYFADRYGFEIVGMIVPGVSTAEATTAQGLAELIDAVRATQAKAIFVEAGGDPRLAEQIAQETGVRVISGLYTHSLSAPDGPAPTYIQMLEFDTQKIVDALK